MCNKHVLSFFLYSERFSIGTIVPLTMREFISRARFTTNAILCSSQSLELG